MAAAASQAEVKAAVTQYLTSKNVPPTQAWLQDFVPSVRMNTPLVALQKTALFRILSTDLTKSVQPSSSAALFPANVSSPDAAECKFPGPIIVQVLDIEDVGHSRWGQVENIEAHERGEMTKGREIIRVVDDDTNTDSNYSASSGPESAGPHKLLLQSANGVKVYGFEIESVTGVGVQQLGIGAKLVLKDVLLARGVVLLEPNSVEVLGGKVEVWDKKWRAERKDVLKRKAGMGG